MYNASPLALADQLLLLRLNNDAGHQSCMQCYSRWPDHPVLFLFSHFYKKQHEILQAIL